jgi:hypothetical protein
MWMGGTIPLGYDVKDRKLIVNKSEAATVRLIFRRYLALGCVSKLRVDLDRKGVRSSSAFSRPAKCLVAARSVGVRSITCFATDFIAVR